MATWNASVRNSSFDADTYAQKAKSTRYAAYNHKKEKSLDGGSNWLGKGYDVVGINASKVSSVINEMESYLGAIKTEVSKMESNQTAMNKAFKGTELQKAVTAYIGKIEKFILDYSSQIRAFEDKLIDVRDAWNNAQKNQGAQINKTSSGFTTINAYNRQKQL